MGVQLHEDQYFILTLTLSPAAVAANTTAEQTFTLPNLRSTDVILSVNKPTAQAGLGIVGMRAAAANTVGVTFSNNTAASITPSALETYSIAVFRPEEKFTAIPD